MKKAILFLSVIAMVMLAACSGKSDLPKFDLKAAQALIEKYDKDPAAFTQADYQQAIDINQDYMKQLDERFSQFLKDGDKGVDAYKEFCEKAKAQDTKDQEAATQRLGEIIMMGSSNFDADTQKKLQDFFQYTMQVMDKGMQLEEKVDPTIFENMQQDEADGGMYLDSDDASAVDSAAVLDAVDPAAVGAELEK